MSIVKAIENIEVELQNNENMATATDSRYASLAAQVDAMRSQNRAMGEQLDKLATDISTTRSGSLEEFRARADAMRAIIGE